jgi:hypothetical protein
MLVQRGNIHTSKSIAIIFGVGLGIYLIYLHTVAVSQISRYGTRKCSNPEELNAILSSSCGRIPSYKDLNITDEYWQVTDTSNGTFYLFNAYYDDRLFLNGGPVVRILAMINRIDPIVKTNCQFWYEGSKKAVIVEVHEYVKLWPKYWGENKNGATPYLVTCFNPFAEKLLVPMFVALTEGKCEKSNNLFGVRNKRPEKNERKKKFLVSVKGIDFEDDITLQLIEWFEILKLLGADKVETFVVKAHIDVMRVLQFYQDEGFVSMKFLSYPSDLPNKRKESWHQWSQNDLIPYHDSFYDNLHLYDFMIPMDIDEFIMPAKPQDRTWVDLLRSTNTGIDFDSYTASNRYFLLKSSHENETIDGIPKRLRFLSNIYRAANVTPHGGNVKTFMRMDRIQNIHNHYPQFCLNGEKCKKFTFNSEDAYLAHYRSDCDNPECKESKEDPTTDVTLWKYRVEILNAVNKTIQKLKETVGLVVELT